MSGQIINFGKADPVLTVNFGYGTTITKSVKITLKKSEMCNNKVLSTLWAQEKVNELKMFSEMNKDELVALGKQYGVKKQTNKQTNF